MTFDREALDAAIKAGFSDNPNETAEENAKRIVATYMTSIKAHNYRAAVQQLGESREGLRHIIRMCQELEESCIIHDPHKELTGALVYAIRLIACQADAHLGTRLN